MRQIKLRSLVAALFAALFVFATTLGEANAQGKKKKGGGGVIRLESIVIEGRVQKPNAFFINTRQALVYEVMEVNSSFVAEIPRALDEGPF